MERPMASRARKNPRPVWHLDGTVCQKYVSGSLAAAQDASCQRQEPNQAVEQKQ
jgi:hypothetical protein